MTYLTNSASLAALSERCSCGGLYSISLGCYSPILSAQLTEMEVVVLGVSNEQDTGDDVKESCSLISLCIVSSISPSRNHGCNLRAGDPFPLKYLFLYHEIGPLDFGAGAEPRGSFS